MLQMFHFEALNKLANVDRKMEAETRTQLQKSLLDKINDLYKKGSREEQCLMTCALFPF